MLFSFAARVRGNVSRGSRRPRLWSWLAVLALAAGWPTAPAQAAAALPPAHPAAAADLPDGLYAQIDTPRGALVLALAFEQAPLTVTSFVGLAEGRLGPRPGRPFFDGLTFHRVVPGFVIQGGDPLGTGEGGPGYTFPDEFAPGLRHEAAGVLSMANSGPDTNGSQFFLTLRDTTRLDYLHSVFGRIVRGREWLDQVRPGDPMRVTILRRGEKARAFAADAAAFAARLRQARPYRGPAEPGPQGAFDDPDHVLPTDVPRARNFNFKLANFERATGVPVRACVLGAASGASWWHATEAERAALLRARAQALGIERQGVLAVCLTSDASAPRCLLWVSEPLRARCGAAIAPGATLEAALAQAQTQAEQRGQALWAEAQRVAAAKPSGAPSASPAPASASASAPSPAALRAKYAVDALLDVLLPALAPSA